MGGSSGDSQVTAHSCLVLGSLVGLGASVICVAVVSMQARGVAPASHHPAS